MKYIFILPIVVISQSAWADSYIAKCTGFSGQKIDHVSGRAEEFKLDDGTVYEFRFSDNPVVGLKYVVTGTGIMEPKKEDRWHDLNIIGHSSNYVSGGSFEGTEQIQFSLYPQLKSVQILWSMQPTKMKNTPVTLLIKASCEFTSG